MEFIDRATAAVTAAFTTFGSDVARYVAEHEDNTRVSMEELITRGEEAVVAEFAKVGNEVTRLLEEAEEYTQTLRELVTERDRSLAQLQAEIDAARREVAQNVQKTGHYEQRLDALREQRDIIATSAIALAARTLAADKGSNPVLFLSSQGNRRTAVYPLADGTLSLSPLSGQGVHPVFLITQPKAGTYLVARLLTKLGLVNTEIHAERFGFSDYRHKSIDEMREDYLKFTTHIPIEVSAGLVAPGQFSVGHLPHGDHSVNATLHMRRILLIRNARDALVSFMRFSEIPGRAEQMPKSWMNQLNGPDRLAAFLDLWGGTLVSFMRTILGWLNERNVLVARFEELMGDAGLAVQQQVLEAIAEHVGAKTSQDLVSLFVNDVVGKPTKTYSGARSETRRYWDERVEARFIEIGGLDLQRDLGYPDIWLDTNSDAG